jgi:hypothetical protein
LKANKISFTEIPLIFQYNKRDLKEILPIEVLNKDLNPDNKPFFPTIATTGENVLEALHTIMKMVIIYLKNRLTVFQKDKTVVFSREEATDTIIAPRDVKPVKKGKEAGDLAGVDKGKEDTEKEELFELSGPMVEESMETQNYPKKGPDQEADEEIFDLEDDSMVGVEDEGDILDIPEANLKDELGNLDEEEDAGKMEPEPEPVSFTSGMEEAKPAPAPAQTQVDVDKIIQVPLNVQVPEDKDEIKINLNLQIVIKKE